LTALREKARQYYGKSLTAYDPVGDDLKHLKDRARWHAESITRTYNRQVESQLNKLFSANPRGNRNYYAKAMEAWVKKRNAWHPDAVAGGIVGETREYAKARFLEMNRIRPRGFVLSGPSPVCDECMAALAAGVVTLEYTQRVRMPNHWRCDHEWEELPGAKVPPLRDVWLGR